MRVGGRCDRARTSITGGDRINFNIYGLLSDAYASSFPPVIVSDYFLLW